MKKSFFAIAVIFAVTFMYGFNNSETGDPEGKTVFVNSKCGTCHSVEQAGLTTKTKKKNVPDLSEVGKKYDQDFISGYIAKKEKINEKVHPSAFKGSDEDITKLTEWLSSLKGTK